MRLRNLGILLFTLLAICEARRVRVQTRPRQEEVEARDVVGVEQVDIEDDNKAQPAIQYYSAAEPQDNQGRVILVASDDDYNGPYGQPTLRPRADYNRPTPTTRSQTPVPIARSKDHATKPPPVQTIRNYSKVNDDGSFTFGYEAADGSFKEETRGTDCVVRGKYGYVDPDGNKREFTYVSGNPCDPNNPESEEEQERSEEDSDENIPQNYPRRPPIPRPVRPLHTTPRPTTTVFQNNYAHASLPQQDETGSEESEEQEPIQYIQPQRPTVTQRPIIRTQPQEVTIRERPRVTFSTTPTPAAVQYTPSHPVSITPRPTYRAPTQTLQTQPPATTYRPALTSTQKPSSNSYHNPPQNYPSQAQEVSVLPTKPTSGRRPIDFAAEFQKFQDETNSLTPSTATPTVGKPFKAAAALPTGNPIYQSQLIFDPSTGQYDANLYQQLPQSEGDFALSHRIQPYVHVHPSPTLVTLEQLQNQSPLYRQPIAQPQNQPPPQQLRPAPIPVPQFSQQVYQKSQENLQVLNSQQLFAQQQELAQQQLQHDRLHAATKKTPQAAQPHRFQVAQPQRPQAPPPQFYYIQPAPGGSLGQIDAFLRGQNLDY